MTGLHWKGALSMPMDITDSYESELDASQSVIFYCTHGGSSMKLARGCFWEIAVLIQRQS